LIREGYFADITIFDPKTVIDRATFEEPNQYPVGINFVIVNGQIEVDNGKRTPALAGRVLRGPGYQSNRREGFARIRPWGVLTDAALPPHIAVRLRLTIPLTFRKEAAPPARGIASHQF
jgi:hypothetical protein